MPVGSILLFYYQYVILRLDISKFRVDELYFYELIKVDELYMCYTLNFFVFTSS